MNQIIKLDAELLTKVIVNATELIVGRIDMERSRQKPYNSNDWWRGYISGCVLGWLKDAEIKDASE